MTWRHGSSGYGNYGCRCEVCRAGHSERMARERVKLRAKTEAEIPHGTLGGYTNYGCRCYDCKAAHRNYERARRAAA